MLILFCGVLRIKLLVVFKVFNEILEKFLDIKESLFWYCVKLMVFFLLKIMDLFVIKFNFFFVVLLNELLFINIWFLVMKLKFFFC